MVAKEFIDLFRSIQLNSNLSVDDFADRLNLFTVILLLLCVILVSVKQYVFNSISCYIPVSPSGSEFKNYVADYCWVHGTIPLRPDEDMPTTPEEWDLYDKYRRISKLTFLSRPFISLQPEIDKLGSFDSFWLSKIRKWVKSKFGLKSSRRVQKVDQNPGT